MMRHGQLVLIMMAFLLLMSMDAWAASQQPATAAPIPADETGVPDDALPFDPFADEYGDAYADEEEALQTVADPIAGFNRAMFTFNDKMYFWFLKPVAIGFRTVIPTPLRVGIKNFFFNLLMPVRFVNCLLQGKGEAAGGELSRFMVNSTIGLAGFLNPAQAFPELNPPEEDLGQTLGHYAVGNGFYIVWPLVGPSTLRDTVGAIGDWALNPISFMQLVNLDAGALTSSTTNVAAYGIRTVNDTTFRIGDYETLKNAALDPYEAFRDAYIQNRISKIAR